MRRHGSGVEPQTQKKTERLSLGEQRREGTRERAQQRGHILSGVIVQKKVAG